ncbi:hypothetical protein N577_010815 [Lacticaseibacillus rhamnosus 2166]|nr:hypothetical protein N577_010815 [Lacticaseibacillus rhamnosus 2166]
MKHAKSGMTVLCQANGNMEYDFIGRIEKCYENSALVTILDYDPEISLMFRTWWAGR